jgi:hypothetical protein
MDPNKDQEPEIEVKEASDGSAVVELPDDLAPAEDAPGTRPRGPRWRRLRAKTRMRIPLAIQTPYGKPSVLAAVPSANWSRRPTPRRTPACRPCSADGRTDSAPVGDREQDALG